MKESANRVTETMQKVPASIQELDSLCYYVILQVLVMNKNTLNHVLYSAPGEKEVEFIQSYIPFNYLYFFPLFLLFIFYTFCSFDTVVQLQCTKLFFFLAIHHLAVNNHTFLFLPVSDYFYIHPFPSLLSILQSNHLPAHLFLTHPLIYLMFSSNRSALQAPGA